MIFTERISKFSKRTSLFPICYLCIYTWSENYIKAILRVIRSSNGFPRGRNEGTFYSSSSSSFVTWYIACLFDLQNVRLF